MYGVVCSWYSRIAEGIRLQDHAKGPPHYGCAVKGAILAQALPKCARAWARCSHAGAPRPSEHVSSADLREQDSAVVFLGNETLLAHHHAEQFKKASHRTACGSGECFYTATAKVNGSRHFPNADAFAPGNIGAGGAAKDPRVLTVGFNS